MAVNTNPSWFSDLIACLRVIITFPEVIKAHECDPRLLDKITA